MKEKELFEEYFKMISSVVRANFYNKELEDVKREIAEFFNDIDGYWMEISDKQLIDITIRSAYFFSLIHIILPTLYSIFLNLLLGYLPACFMGLRLIVETSSKALATDYIFKFEGVSLEGVDMFEKHLWKKERISMSKFLSEKFSRIVGKEVAGRTKGLWNKLSGKWIHFRGIAKRINREIKKGKVPTNVKYLYLPVELDIEDTEDLRELANVIAETRDLLKIFHKHWKNLVKSYYTPTSLLRA